ncbi:MAG: glutathione S-transferase family protein [Rhodospirillaceae bacterium]|jgi:glutathione S-transferase|nr:glutathione S-transferase family protein [Rhodospirillaceae bacterium]MBT5664745.1 glutathione S-transferase family protein [Rhodospirillaceae bacterium]
MVKLADGDIQTREALDYKGLHLFHYSMSSCSQKLRAYLNLKGVAWDSHIVDLSKQEQNDPWFLGINPRGLVPVLIDDGAVHIESNDIIAYLERKFPEPVLIPADRAAEISTLLRFEDDLHLDLRTLSFRFVHGRTGSPKSATVMQQYRSGGAGTVLGRTDPEKQRELDFYDRLARDGISDAAVRDAAAKFRAAFDDFEQGLAGHQYLIGPALTIVDVAWYVYVKRLTLAGYPFQRLHPRIEAWFNTLDERPEFHKAVETPKPLMEKIAATCRTQAETGATLAQVAGYL